MSRNPKRKAAGGNHATNPTKQPIYTTRSVNAQRQRLLAALRRGAVTTLDARRNLDIMHPAARVQELRDRGNKIETHWRDEATDCGEIHRVAAYVLLGEARL